MPVSDRCLLKKIDPSFVLVFVVGELFMISNRIIDNTAQINVERLFQVRINLTQYMYYYFFENYRGGKCDVTTLVTSHRDLINENPIKTHRHALRSWSLLHIMFLSFSLNPKGT